MILQDLVSGLKEMEFQVAYSHFAEGEVPKCPYIVVQGMGSDNFSADGIVYHEVEDTNIELYCDKKDLEAEKKISDFLTENKIYYEKQKLILNQKN